MTLEIGSHADRKHAPHWKHFLQDHRARSVLGCENQKRDNCYWAHVLLTLLKERYGQTVITQKKPLGHR